ncbi:MAG: histidine phosphatase family protein [Proteobacteria bacterium]|nr:histidine phosphatase family protein [Pseudomonadota bacterium]MBU1059514.1 histidine phosphatase family protein [Pseudomonadota bacterium]
MNRRLILLRHGETGFPDRYIGSTDVPLSSAGVSQLRDLKTIFQDQDIDLIISSPMERCRQCAEILFPERSIRYDNALREIDFGHWEGLSFAEIKKADPGLVDQWATWSRDFCFPQGERIGSFLNRIHTVGEQLSASREKTTLLISHGGVIRTLLCYFLKLVPSDFLLFQIDKGRFATLNLFKEGGVLTGLNLGASAWGD